MKYMKKLAAGVVAAATMIGGLAIGASVANASVGESLKLAPVDTNLKEHLYVRSAQGAPEAVAGHTFTAVRLGTYLGGVEAADPEGAPTDDGDGNVVHYASQVNVGTQTYADVDIASIAASILGELDEDSSTEGTQNGYAGSDYAKSNNPIGYVAANYAGYGSTSKDTTSATKPWAGLLRDFVTKIAANEQIQSLIAKGAGKGSADYNAWSATGKSDADSNTATADLWVRSGMYLIMDTTDGANTLPMLAGTKITSSNGIVHYDAVGNYNAGMSLGLVNVKAPDTLAFSKQVKHKDAADSTYATTMTGKKDDRITYRLEGNVPQGEVTKYMFVDRPERGQNLNMYSFHVFATDDSGKVVKDFGTGANDGESGIMDSAVDYRTYRWYDMHGEQGVPNDDDLIGFKSSILGGGQDFNNYGFVVDLAPVIAQAREAGATKFVVTVDGSITGDPNHSSDNLKVDTVTNTGWLMQGNETSKKQTVTINLMSPVDVAFTKVAASNTDKKLQGAEFEISTGEGQTGVLPATTKATSDENGRVAFSKLGAGTYTVTETKAPEGYLSNALPAFTLTVNADGTFTMEGTGAFAGLVDNEAKQVKNAASVTELPLTGGVGIALFLAVAVAMLGAAVFGVNRYRSASRALKA